MLKQSGEVLQDITENVKFKCRTKICASFKMQVRPTWG